MLTAAAWRYQVDGSKLISEPILFLLKLITRLDVTPCLSGEKASELMQTLDR